MPEVPTATPNNQVHAGPTARREPRSITMHGHTLVDDYAWLRSKDSPETLSYLQAENEYTAAEMADTRDLQAELYQEMLSHIKETDESVPYSDHGWFYLTRTVEGSQYPIYCRHRGDSLNEALSAPEEVLLDVNLLAEGEAFMAVGGMSVSPDGARLAYSTDNSGFRQYTLRIRDLNSNEDLAYAAERVGSFTWAADSQTIFYTTEDEQTKRQDKLFRHTIADETTGSDPLVYSEPDERFNIGIGRTRDRRYLLLECGSHTATECWYLAADQPLGEFQLIAPRKDDEEYYADHRGGRFYIRTNDVTRTFRLVTAEVGNPGRENWQELYRSEQGLPLEDFDVFQDFCVLSERRAGLPILTVYNFTFEHDLDEFREIQFPEPTYTAAAHVNREFATAYFRYSYTSLIAPPSVYEYDNLQGTAALLKQQEVPGGFDIVNYGSERLWVEAADGAMIPVSLVYRRDLFRAGKEAPLYVYGYGSYGYALPVGFSPSRLTLLDRGLVLAYAHIRGGGELGDPWHDAGKMQHKQNTFTDFISVAEALVKQGYGGAGRVAIEGGSAGGLLMGAVVNLRPDLFRVVLSHVPFVDVMNTMLDATLPLTVAEYEEWGNPNQADAFAYMLGYSPYDNLKEGSYPSMLVKTSLNDSQVMYWEPAKYVAKLRTLKRNTSPLLLHINMEAGHGGASGRYDYLKEIAFDYAFLLRELGVQVFASQQE